jgi:hypothetical protein
MGLLDDAIREHLELKRKHGANPEDVERQEKEALGQGGPQAEFAQPAAAEREPPPVAEPPDPPQAAEPEPDPDPEPPAPEPPQAAEPPITEQPTETHPAPVYGDPWLDDEPDEVPAEEALETRTDPATGEEDVLEETPDFLQETPEHDRLWFEQKPPRDFDWDK